MKNFKMKYLGIFLLIFCISQFFVCSTYADDLAKKKIVEIPDIMAPHTIIEYVSDDEYVIVQGGEYEFHGNTSTADASNSLLTQDDGYTENEIEPSKEVQKYIDAIGEENIIIMDKVKPNKGTMVYYADDGRIQEIQISHIVENGTYATAAATCPNCGKSVISAGTYPPDRELPVNYSWGGATGKNNIITIFRDRVEGRGRFTNFTDTIGENDNILRKGDVATRFHVDNPIYGKTIYCEANGYEHRMYKRDVGCLPDAVLDIWKTGLEYFGIEWGPNVSIYDGTYCYLR